MKKHLPLVASCVKYVAIMAFIFGPISYMAQPKTEAPAAVKKALQAQYAGAEDLTWKQKAKKTWMAEFEVDDHSYSSRYSEDGKWIETEKKVKAKELPEVIQKKVASENVGWTITRARHYTSPSDTYYFVFIENELEELRSLRFDESGKAIEKVKRD